MATVLYVDDEDAIRRAVVMWLSRKGHVVHAVSSVAAARELLATQPIDGAFIDLWLGNESGLELQDWIDEHRPEFAANVVFVTGDPTSDESGSRALRSLGRPVVGKPFDLEELERWIARWATPPRDQSSPSSS
jgi:DNA-binding NtrC family response regulator